MKKIAFSIAFVAAGALAGEWSGTISDAKCGKAHAAATEKDRKCVEGCVKGGQKAVLVTSDGNVVKIANQDKVASHLGHKVTVKGDLDGDTVTISEVAMAH
jgi:hypothetical protein